MSHTVIYIDTSYLLWDRDKYGQELWLKTHINNNNQNIKHL